MTCFQSGLKLLFAEIVAYRQSAVSVKIKMDLSFSDVIHTVAPSLLLFSACLKK